MKMSMIIVLVMIPMIFASTVEVGSSEFITLKPFCGDCTPNYRYQIVLEASIFNQPTTINSMEYFIAPGGTCDEITFQELYVYAGYTEENYLSDVFDDNYTDGVKYTVFDSPSEVSIEATDPAIYFDAPFFYDPALGNLVIEIGWVTGHYQLTTYNFSSPTESLLSGAYGATSGDLYMETPHLLIHTYSALNQTTFAGIKASF